MKNKDKILDETLETLIRYQTMLHSMNVQKKMKNFDIYYLLS